MFEKFKINQKLLLVYSLGITTGFAIALMIIPTALGIIASVILYAAYRLEVTK